MAKYDYRKYYVNMVGGITIERDSGLTSGELVSRLAAWLEEPSLIEIVITRTRNKQKGNPE
jgi:hypothetical protein